MQTHLSQSLQEPNKQKKEQQKLNAKFAHYTGSTIKVAAVILVFYYIGSWLDGKFTFDKPWFSLCFSLIGVAVGIYSLIKDLME